MLFIDLAALSLPLFSAAFFFVRYPQAAIPFLMPLFFMLWQGASSLYLETGVFSRELFVSTYRTGATLRYSIAFTALVIGYCAVFSYIIKKKTPAAKVAKTDKFLVSFFPYVLLITTVILLSYAPDEPVLSRGLYFATNPAPVRDFFFKYLPLSAFAAGISAAFAQRKREVILSYFSAILAVFMLTKFGHKFSGLLDFLFAFFLPVFVKIVRDIATHTLKKQDLVLSIATLIVSGLLANMSFKNYFQPRAAEYSNVYSSQKSTSEVANSFIRDRLLILQGGMWWITDLNTNRGKASYAPEVFKYTKRIASKENQPFSIFLMEKAIGKERTEYVLSRGTQYTGTFPAIFAELGGPWATVPLCLITGAVFAIIAAYLVLKVLAGQTLLAILAFMVFIPIYNFTLNGELFQFTIVNLFIKLLMIFMTELGYRHLLLNNSCTTCENA